MITKVNKILQVKEILKEKYYNDPRLRRRKVYELFSSPKSFIKFMLYDLIKHERKNLILIIWDNGQKVGEMLSWSLRDLCCSLET